MWSLDNIDAICASGLGGGDKTLKTLAFRDAALEPGLDWNLVNLAVTFANPGDPSMVGGPIKRDLPNIDGGGKDV